MRNDQQGISNRETASEEEQERQEFPQVTPDAPPVEQDVAGRAGEEPIDDDNRQTSQKTGTHSSAQKVQSARYAEGAPPSTHKVAGAHGAEPTQDFGRREDTDTPRPEESGG